MKTTILKRSVAILLSILFSFMLLATAFAEEESKINRFNVVLVVDASGSMAKTSDPTGLRYNAIRQFINLLTEQGNYLGAVVFSDTIRLQQDISEVTSQADKDNIMAQIQGQAASGYTDIGSALSAAVGMLKTVDNDLPSVIVFLSDGATQLQETGDATLDAQALANSQALEQAAIRDAQAEGIAIHTVFLNYEGSMDQYGQAGQELQQIADGTGGKLIPVTQASDLTGVFNTFYEMIYGTSVVNVIDTDIPQEGIVYKDFSVPFAGVEEINIIINGENVGVTITDPNGGQSYQALDSNQSYQFFKITNAVPGTWGIAVAGNPGIHIDVNMVYNYDLNLVLQAAADHVAPGETYTVTAKVKAGNDDVDPGDYAFYSDAKLYLDPGDGSAPAEVDLTFTGDGYTAEYVPTQEGWYTVTASAIASFGDSFLATMPSNALALSVNTFAADITADATDLMAGDPLNVTVNVSSSGPDIDPTNGYATLHIVTPAGEDQPFILTGADGNYSYTYQPQDAGNYEVYATAVAYSADGSQITTESQRLAFTVQDLAMDITLNQTDLQTDDTSNVLSVQASVKSGSETVSGNSAYNLTNPVLHIVAADGSDTMVPMSAAGDQYEAGNTFAKGTEGDYTVYAEVTYSKPTGETVQIKSGEQTISVKEPPVYPPSVKAGKNPVEITVIKWPWKNEERDLDLKECVEDEKQTQEELLYEITESTLDTGNAVFTGSGMLHLNITNSLFDPSNHSLKVKVTDFDDQSAYLDIEVNVFNAGMVCLIALVVILLAAGILIFIRHKTTMSKSFGGPIQARSEVNGSFRGQEMRKPRGRMYLSVFGMEPTGLDYNKSYFQATGSNYIYLITNKKVRYNGNETNKIRIMSAVETVVTVDPATAKRIHIYYTCSQTVAPRRSGPTPSKQKGRKKGGSNLNRPY